MAPGLGIAPMPDDTHAIEGKDAGVMRHLHFYGRALEVLDTRLVFDPAAGTCRPMPIAQSIRVEPGHPLFCGEGASLAPSPW